MSNVKLRLNFFYSNCFNMWQEWSA